MKKITAADNPDWPRKLAHTKSFDYDKWLDYFRLNFTAAALKAHCESLEEYLPPDGYAAMNRWLEIFESPSKMEKLHKATLEKEGKKDILEVAIGDDDEAFYIELIKKSTRQLESSSASQQEVARLTQNLDIFRTKLREIRSRTPKEGTVLSKVLKVASAPPKKPKITKKPAAKARATPPKAAGGVKKKKTGVRSKK